MDKEITTTDEHEMREEFKQKDINDKLVVIYDLLWKLLIEK